jgi:hypothetical protein
MCDEPMCDAPAIVVGEEVFVIWDYYGEGLVVFERWECTDGHRYMKEEE